MSSRKIFIDASVLYAFIDRADPNHITAIKTIEQLSLQGVFLFTPFHAVLDTYSVIQKHMGSAVSQDFLDAMLESSIEVIYPQKADFRAAARLLKLNRNRDITLKEALTTVYMQKRGTLQILTFTFWSNLLGSQSYLSTKL